MADGAAADALCPGVWQKQGRNEIIISTWRRAAHQTSVRFLAMMLASEWGIDSDPIQTPFRADQKSPADPQQRVREMVRYFEHAIRNPNLVGAHFFQYPDQPISGRPDGEAVLRGFVNIADTPNFELVQANRAAAYYPYEKRVK